MPMRATKKLLIATWNRINRLPIYAKILLVVLLLFIVAWHVLFFSQAFLPGGTGDCAAIDYGMYKCSIGDLYVNAALVLLFYLYALLTISFSHIQSF